MINIGGNFTARGRENCTKRAVLLLLSLILLMSFLHFSVAEESKGNETVLASLQLDRTEIQLQKGYRTQIHATVLNLPKGVRASKYEWTTSDDMVATIRNGSVKGVGGGNAELTCTATLTDGTVLMAACEVYVTVPVNELKATNRSITIMAGDTYIPEIQVLPEDATNKAYLLSSGNEQILTVDAEGQITAQAEGKTTLTATSEDQPDKSVRLSVTVTRRIGKTDGEILFQGVPWGSDCETTLRILKEKGFISEDAGVRSSSTHLAWYWPENDLMFSQTSAWRSLPAIFADRQAGAERTSMIPRKTIGGYLPQTATLLFLNGIDSGGKCDPEATRLTGVFFQFDNRHEKGTIIFTDLLKKLEKQYGEFRRYLQKDIPRYYPEMFSEIQEAMAGAVEYALQEPGMVGYLGEYAICTIRGDRNTGIMLSLDTNGIVTLFYGRTDTADMIRELEKALQEETPELEDAGV